VILEPDASIAAVERKFAKNAEVRRAVIGQLLSDAASLTELDVDELLDRFRAWLGRDAVVALAPDAGASARESEDVAFVTISGFRSILTQAANRL
jgi:hypothetical protein